ncbi:MAG: hypothetical protein IT369_23305 [Candidatus Latescibacteria bacterium]|nr:hypothetical protein [Candidatus Latescibacterota bacterium]
MVQTARYLNAAVLVLLLALPALSSAQQGYAIRGNQVLVNRAEHWQAWTGAAGVLDISAQDHTVHPRYIRKEINAALDASSFSATGAGGAKVGSNPAEAGALIDGDPLTSWGPASQAQRKDWWVEVNLGRLVVVKKVIVRFAAAADPFLQFKILGWRQPPPRSVAGRDYLIKGTDIPNFWELGRTTKPNKTERVFEFEIRPTEVASNHFVGDPLERIQIIATDSDTTRGQEVEAAEYSLLPSEQQGAIEYFRREASGRESLVSAAEYQVIAAERRGPVRYYRREQPRIAEIEVWTEGDNVNTGSLDRGGQITIETNSGPKDIGATVTDGNYNTGHSGSIFDYRVYEFFADLGTLFWLDTMHFITDGENGVDELFVDVSDGSRAPDGSILWTRVAESRAAVDGSSSAAGIGLRYRQIAIPPSRVRYLRTPFQNPLSALSYIGFNEIMLYGEGYVPEVVLTSDLITLGGRKSLTSIEWEGDTPAGTQILLQTRTGNELDEVKIYHDSNGNVVDERKYNSLPKSKKGEVEVVYLPGSDWSSWSLPYSRSGQEIESPSPRQSMEIRAVLLSDAPHAAASLRSITVNTADPLADHLAGEVWPNRVEQTGTPTEFSFFIHPDFAQITRGFNEVRLEATAGTAMDLLEVRTGTATAFHNGQATSFMPAALQVMATPADTLWFRLPAKVGKGTELVEVRFRATLYGNSASFRGLVQDSAAPGLWQRVDAADPTDLVDSQTTTVVALEGVEVIQNFRVGSRVVTPNGDGVNDELVFSFDVVRVNAERPVSAAIYDLSGRLVNQISEVRPDPRGAYTLRWTGDDQGGRRVPPGIYLARIGVAADAAGAGGPAVQEVIHVAY